ncbi:hypothetical protein EKK58_02725 [Candidatus Dependentiae bacterium]|nr:MAG: hypothetical protein EKK58_02725 [Candidatus Dependentiae bacterium]
MEKSSVLKPVAKSKESFYNQLVNNYMPVQNKRYFNPFFDSDKSLMFFYTAEKSSDKDIFKRMILAKQISFYSKQSDRYTVFLTPAMQYQASVFTFLIELCKKNPLVFQHSQYQDVRLLDIIFNVRVNIEENFSEVLATPRFAIDIVNVFSEDEKLKFDSIRTKEYTLQLAIFLKNALEQQFDGVKWQRKSIGIKFTDTVQLHAWISIMSQGQVAKDSITQGDLNFSQKQTNLYEFEQNKMYNKEDVFAFTLVKNRMSKNYFARIIFGKKFKVDTQENKLILNVLTNSYFIILKPTLKKKKQIIQLLHTYKNQNPVVYKNVSGDGVHFNDIVHDIVDLQQQTISIGIIINNMLADSVKKLGDALSIDSILDMQNTERTKEYAEKLLLFLYSEFKKKNYLSLPKGFLDRIEMLSGLAHVKDLFFVTQRSPLTKTSLPKHYFDAKYNYAYFNSNITGIEKQYAIDPNLLDDPEEREKNMDIIADGNKELAQSLGNLNNHQANPSQNTPSWAQIIYGLLKMPFVGLYNFFVWLFN